MVNVDLLLDTSVLIKIWRGDAELYREILAFQCGVDTVVLLEFLQGVNRRQKSKADEFVAAFEFVPFTADISYRAVELIREYSHSKGLRMPDALIAATSLELNIPLLTLNIKHFDFIKGIELI